VPSVSVIHAVTFRFIDPQFENGYPENVAVDENLGALLSFFKHVGLLSVGYYGIGILMSF
jgi:hypothetical protein